MVRYPELRFDAPAMSFGLVAGRSHLERRIPFDAGLLAEAMDDFLLGWVHLVRVYADSPFKNGESFLYRPLTITPPGLCAVPDWIEFTPTVLATLMDAIAVFREHATPLA